MKSISDKQNTKADPPMRPSPVRRAREADASFLSPAEGNAFLSDLGNGEM